MNRYFAGRRALGLARSLACVLLLGTAIAGTVLAAEPDDPLEPVNRAVLGLNETAWSWGARLVGGLADGAVGRSAGNFVANLRAPAVLANDLLQGETGRARTTLERFVVNSTVGVFGLFDPASGYGLPRHQEDAGQTLAVHGVPAGPYLMLPLLGPSNLRDTVGRVADWMTLNFYLLDAKGLDAVAGGGDGLDTYVALRSAHAQARAAEIGNGRSDRTAGEYDRIFATTE